MSSLFKIILLFIPELLDDASWGPEREIVLERVHNKSFGISIVGGKVR